ncbi:glycoside hydrolase family 13 carbohydrate-binding module family 20 protein [Pseudocercospora fijiensis CIRAD86]|uniref:alpha-amylase n=1 Tax=Pseudocercospora fijiensis (strain CIRAD86) TaxID=383855 RepID=M2YZY4_PSEFD|nr:glycoside hydrolase family 13 carbohydrate-binding module family 20 protein [Pseudocercospora fijiensis CIRAD86]EME83175.1 glycoside hydrolase family 13 carbohydrate-binding module family 20 protein [Pseudocercospora fijiensis CIRAD86]
MRPFVLIPVLAGLTTALTSAQWRSQSIYQVITDRFALTNGSSTQACDWGNYCGGTWQGITNKLDYIQGMGFTAVWISPIVKNIANTPYGNPYHGYWAQDIYSLNSAFGTAAELKALSAALHARGMYLMVDVVTNHMAYNGAPANVKYNTFSPFNDQKYYHPYCPLEYGNTTSTQVCWMGDTTVSLPDLRTEDTAVQNGFNQWITQLVANYSIDGLRLDSAMQVNQAFWPGFVKASGVYAVGEVLDGNPTSFCTWQSYMPGALNYPNYFWLNRAFASTSATMTELANNIQWLNSTCTDVTLLGNFLENHDNPRFPTITKDTGLTQNAIAFSILNDGIPIVYYGQEQGFNGAVDPYNREPLWTSGYNTKSSLYTFIAKVNGARNLAIRKNPTYAATKSKVVYSDTKIMATLKQGLLSVFTDSGSSGSGSAILTPAKTGFAGYTKYTDLLSCNVIQTDSSGNLAVTINYGAPRVFYKTSELSGTDLCASTNNIDQSQSRAATTSTSSTILPGRVVDTPAASCAVSGNVSVPFYQNTTTSWGEILKIIGSIDELGKWNTSNAIRMSSAMYTTSNPIWNATVLIPSDTSFEYKFIKVGSSGGVTWESGSNRKYTVPPSCISMSAVNSTWQST